MLDATDLEKIREIVKEEIEESKKGVKVPSGRVDVKATEKKREIRG